MPKQTGDWIEDEARRCRRVLEQTPFKKCFPLEQNFSSLPIASGLYAVKSREEEILYIGKTSNVRGRFQTGHQGLMRAFIDGWSVDDLRIAVVRFGKVFIPFLEDIEARILLALQPVYNRDIPTRQDVNAGMTVAKPLSNVVKRRVIDYLPLYVVERIREYGAENDLNEDEVVELAIAHFFDMESLSFEGCDFESPGEMKERIAILEAQLEAAQRNPKEADL
jgi:hypothetical protein